MPLCLRKRKKDVKKTLISVTNLHPSAEEFRFHRLPPASRRKNCIKNNLTLIQNQRISEKLLEDQSQIIQKSDMEDTSNETADQKNTTRRIHLGPV